MGVAGNLVGGSTLFGGALINLGYLGMILVGALLLRRQGSSWSRTGLGKPTSRLKTVLFGFSAFVAAAVVFTTIQALVVALLDLLQLMPVELDQSRFNPIRGNLPLFILMVGLSWTTIAFGEELFFRAFLITRLLDHTRAGKTLSIFVAGGVFGAVHFAEGPVGALANGSFGIVYGWIFVRSSRNLWITIIGHGLLNTVRFALLYVGAA
jgi:membrane protease YdiL (CAAX protease family)